MNAEALLEREILRSLCVGPVRLFRNTCAGGWVGTLVAQENGLVTLANARRQTFGLMPGSGDLIGWVKRDGVAVFASLELKAPTGRVRPEQLVWDQAVRTAGGVSGIVRSVEEARSVLTP